MFFLNCGYSINLSHARQYTYEPDLSFFGANNEVILPTMTVIFDVLTLQWDPNRKLLSRQLRKHQKENMFVKRWNH